MKVFSYEGKACMAFLLPKYSDERIDGVLRTGKVVASSLFIAFGVMLPVAFHFFGALGRVFLPMHIPVLIAGLFLGGYAGLAVGALTPVLSSLLTGMPPLMPTLPVMAAELAVYGAAGGYLYNVRRWNLYVSLTAAMVAGRLAAAMMVYALATMLNINISPAVYVTGAFVTGLPGIVIQLALVPLLVRRLQAVFVKYVC
jgi:hypothetical protein